MSKNHYFFRYETAVVDETEGVVSELVIIDAHLQDSGTLVCSASNAHGSISSDFHLAVQGNLLSIFLTLHWLINPIVTWLHKMKFGYT